VFNSVDSSEEFKLPPVIISHNCRHPYQIHNPHMHAQSGRERKFVTKKSCYQAYTTGKRSENDEVPTVKDQLTSTTKSAINPTITDLKGDNMHPGPGFWTDRKVDDNTPKHCKQLKKPQYYNLYITNLPNTIRVTDLVDVDGTSIHINTFASDKHPDVHLGLPSANCSQLNKISKECSQKKPPIKKRKVPTTVKIDGKPKRPMSAFLLFYNDQRSSLKYSNLSNRDLGRLCGDLWKELSSDQKDMWREEAATLQQEYKKKLANWKELGEAPKKKSAFSYFLSSYNKDVESAGQVWTCMSAAQKNAYKNASNEDYRSRMASWKKRCQLYIPLSVK